MNIEFMCELLANYSKELSEAETYREKGEVQLKHAKLILDKVKNYSIPAVVGQSEQFKCEHPDEAIIRDKPTDYCLACNRNI